MSDTLTNTAPSFKNGEEVGRTEWVLVPREPTEDMVQAGWIDKEDVDPDDIYRAMIAAAPLPAGLHADPGHIPMPRNADEAKAMWLLGEHWVRANAPELIASAPSPDQGGISPSGGGGERGKVGACLTAPGSCPSGDAPDGSSSQATAIPSRRLCPSCQGERGGLIGVSGGSPDWDDCWTCGGEGFLTENRGAHPVFDRARTTSDPYDDRPGPWYDMKRVRLIEPRDSLSASGALIMER